MKKSLLALAALTAFAGAASAQSSVTLSGSVDAGVRLVGVTTKSATGVDNGTTYDKRIAGSQSGYNAFTISGVEDLGNGARAIFVLNHRFVLGTGAVNGTTNAGGTVPFWRNAYVGLGGGFGEVRVGRALMPIQEVNGNEPFGTGTVGSVSTGGIAATIRANNNVNYRTPNLGGFTATLAVATASDQTTDEVGNPGLQAYFARASTFASEKPIGFNARYKGGPVDVAVGYDKNSSDMKTVGFYASYDLGVVKLMGQYEKGDNYTTPGTTAAPLAQLPEDIKAFSLGLTAPLGPVLLRTGFLKIKSDRVNRDASKFGFGGDYNLSKRTNLYATVGKWSGNRAGAAGSFTATANKKAQVDFGVTHRF